MAKKQATSVTAVKHPDKRANIPTEELRDFVAEDEKAPKAVLYPRDPSLDPQLVWKGKDEQDAADLEVPAVPVYIQEKIHPQAIIEDVRASAKAAQPEPQLELYADFNGIEFEDLIDFYHHGQNWANRMILGDSLLVMTSLAEKEGLKGKVQMIYLDPPYGIKFGSNWQVSTRKRDVKDGKAEDATRQPEQVKAFRDTWELGIHSYLAYLRDRLVVARELLTESGSVFVQIGDENVHLVRCLLDEVFGSENFVSLVTFRKKEMSLGAKHLDAVSDYILWYARNRDVLKHRDLFAFKEVEGDAHWDRIAEEDGSRRKLTPEEVRNHRLLPAASRLYRLHGLSPARGINASGLFAVGLDGREFDPPKGSSWSTSREGMARVASAGRAEPYETGNTLQYCLFLDDYPIMRLTNLWDDLSSPAEPIYVVQTNIKAVLRCLLMTTDPGDLVLDPTCGSGTTAYVAEQWGRRWITLDTSRVALALARTRLMAAKFPYYILADEVDPQAAQMAQTDFDPRPHLRKLSGPPDITKGFVYKRVPHITLKSIANNEEIDEIHARWQEKLEPLRAKLNKALGTQWEEWEVPREFPADLCSIAPCGRQEPEPPHKTRKGRRPAQRAPRAMLRDGEVAEAEALLQEWWKARRERQQEIDASIARRADTELLYDQPYEDNKRIRVTGPFTVESLSPHRVLTPEEETPTRSYATEGSGDGFVHLILENLKKAGVQNTVKNERLKFGRLEPFAGTWLHAVGEYTDRGDQSRRVAVSIGPEHGTVGPEQVKEAAKEAMRGLGFDLLVVCGFAFDAHAGETAKEFGPEEFKELDGPVVTEGVKRYGKLPVMLARMNPDLAMGDELLKKTGAGNLFMVFGEPDVEVRAVSADCADDADGKGKGKAKTKGKAQSAQSVSSADEALIVEVRGVDVYDPTTGEIRNSSTDDLACWFLDTNYNGESFFVRHAYFTGANEPYDKLKRALRAEIDEAAWSALYSTISRPFPPPGTGKIAVKVINHYGDEVLKVYEVGRVG